MSSRRASLAGGPGYDLSLPSEPPFMYVERHERRGGIGVIAFGAYNAMGLIGTEAGGVAVVSERPKFVIATLEIPWNPQGRDEEVDAVVEGLEAFTDARGINIPMDRREAFLAWLGERGYRVRG